jgi:hypothetical protein
VRIPAVLLRFADYLQAFDDRAAAVDAGQSTPPTPSFEKQKEVAAKCK